MKIKVTIKEVATGKTKVFERTYDWSSFESAEYFYTEGQGCCNCNLANDFDGDQDNPCINGREFTTVVEEIK